MYLLAINLEEISFDIFYFILFLIYITRMNREEIYALPTNTKINTENISLEELLRDSDITNELEKTL